MATVKERTERIMGEKPAWDKFFDSTENIQCISCLDACMLEYFIGGCRVRVDRLSFRKFSVNIRGYDERRGRELYTGDFSREWKERNIYSQAIYKKFIDGYFFHEDRLEELDKDDIVGIIKEGYAEAVKALKEAEAAYNADRRSVRKKGMFQYAEAKEKALGDLCMELGIKQADDGTPCMGCAAV